MDAARALRRRGVIAARQLAQSASPDLIGAWCAYAESRPAMGPGALVAAIRSGATPPASPGPREARSHLGERSAWIGEHFPDLADHPAAIAAVGRLDSRHGSEHRDADTYEPQIRAAVALFEARFGTPSAEGGDS